MSTPAIWDAVGTLLRDMGRREFPAWLCERVAGIADATTCLVDASETWRVISLVRADQPHDHFDELVNAGIWLAEKNLLRNPWPRNLAIAQIGPSLFLVQSFDIDKSGRMELCSCLLDHGSVRPAWEGWQLLAGLLCVVANFRSESVVVSTPNRAVRRRLPTLAGITFRSVSLQFMRQVVAAVREHHPGVPVREHLVRGHVAFYTKPIGGRPNGFVGAVWKPPHVRGSAEHGRVVKDYVVAPIHPPA